MAMTLKEIADIAGVSRGTVDRVINNRGKVKPATEKHVRQILEKVNYKPNKAGKALAAIRNPIKIGVILASEGNPFFEEVLEGISVAGEEWKDFGVEIIFKSMKGYDVEQQLALIESLVEEGINGLALAPINDQRIVSAINRLVASKITVISLNQDISGSRRMCYVGSDYQKCGEIAAGLIGKFNPSAQVAVVTGNLQMLGHKHRVDGFKKTLDDSYPKIKLVTVEENNDDDNISFCVVKRILNEYPDIDAFFFAAAGTAGGIDALQKFASKKIVTITVDTPPVISQYLQAGWIDATIGQQPFLQGYEAIKILYQYLINGQAVGTNTLLIKNEIFIKESL